MQSLTNERYRAIVESLHRHGVDKFVDLPQVIVVGDQSSGKSSVLTAIAGAFEFPSSATLTTRVPCQVIMTRGEKEMASVSRSSSASNADLLNDRAEIKTAIERVQTEIVEGSKMKDESIVIKLVGRDLPDLTLIDLPGIFRTLKEGQTASDIITVKHMVELFMKATRTLILAVVPANQDLQNCEIIQMAREVDPQMQRTLMVLSKPDLIEKGTDNDVVNAALNIGLPLHVVRCRGKEEREAGITPVKMRDNERAFFASNSAWKDLGDNSIGIEALQHRLSALLQDRIRAELPKVRDELILKLNQAEAGLKELGEDPANARARQALFQEATQAVFNGSSAMVLGNYGTRDFTEFFGCPENRIRAPSRILLEKYNADILKCNAPSTVYCEGDVVRLGETSVTIVSVYDGKVETVRDSTGQEFRYNKNGFLDSSKFAYVMHDAPDKILPDTISPDPHLAGIMRRMRFARGRELCGFLSYDVFISLLVEEIGKWKPLTQKLIDDHLNLVQLAMSSFIKTSVHPKALMELVSDKCNALITTRRDSMNDRVMKLFDQEATPVTENHYCKDKLDLIIVKMSLTLFFQSLIVC